MGLQVFWGFDLITASLHGRGCFCASTSLRTRYASFLPWETHGTTYNISNKRAIRIKCSSLPRCPVTAVTSASDVLVASPACSHRSVDDRLYSWCWNHLYLLHDSGAYIERPCHGQPATFMFQTFDQSSGTSCKTNHKM